MYEEKYLKYKKKYTNLKNKMQITKNDIMLFKAEWCSHCVAFKPIWEKLKKNTKLNKKYNFITIDSENKEQTEMYKISGYPTLLLKLDNKIIEFNGTRSHENIIDFLKSYAK